MNQAIKTIKQIHKNLAKEIREYKSLRKAAVRPKNWSDYTLWSMSRQYRARHIAYCLNRGTPYEKIEKARIPFASDYYLSEKVSEYQEEYKEMYNEANVRVSEPAA